jgi:hypothetical protein
LGNKWDKKQKSFSDAFRVIQRAQECPEMLYDYDLGLVILDSNREDYDPDKVEELLRIYEQYPGFHESDEDDSQEPGNAFEG